MHSKVDSSSTPSFSIVSQQAQNNTPEGLLRAVNIKPRKVASRTVMADNAYFIGTVSTGSDIKVTRVSTCVVLLRCVSTFSPSFSAAETGIMHFLRPLVVTAHS